MAGMIAVDRPSRLGAWLSWVLPLALYAAVCIPIYQRHRDLLSGDGVAYLRRATYLARGDWAIPYRGIGVHC